jgi:hypothetical protein
MVLKIDYVPFINFAMLQNAIPLLRSLTIENTTDASLSNLQVRIWSDPPLFAEKRSSIESIAARSCFQLADVSLLLLREPLRKQTEREEGNLWVEVAENSNSICREAYPLSMLAYNEWHGASALPEIVAAHVLPNDPAVDKLLAEASKILLRLRLFTGRQLD